MTPQNLSIFRLELDAQTVLSRRDLLEWFGRAFGFPDYPELNWDSLLDCAWDLRAPTETTGFRFSLGESAIALVHVRHSEDFARRLPVVWREMLETVALANQAQRDKGAPAILALLLL